MDQLLVALDVDTAAQARTLADALRGAVGGFKIGSQLFTNAGPSFVEELAGRGDRVFLDLKFHDIPNTVAQACAAATRLGVWMLNVHAAGGSAMLAAARASVDATAAVIGRPKPLLIAVAVLTSLGDQDLTDIGVAESAPRQALRLARLTAAAGLDGVVCSAVEAPGLRSALGPRFTLVTPGIRPAGSSKDDQTRIITPEAAIANGADYLVIGRPITQAADPVEALAAINKVLRVSA